MASSWLVRNGGSEEEEDTFFDSQPEFAPLSSPVAPLPLQGGLDSVRERRERFARAMGLECSSRHRVDSGGDFDDIHEAAVPEVARLSFQDENSSGACSTRSCSSDAISSSGDGASDDSSSKGSGHEVDKSFSSLPSFIQRLLHRDSNSPPGAFSDRSRHGWLRRLRAGACAVDYRGDEASTSSSSDGDLQYERVKVRAHRKRTKEFSDVYRGQVIKAHDGAILTMKFSPDGELLATGGEDGAVRVWRVTQADGCDVPTDDSSCVYLKMGDSRQVVMAPVDAGNAKKCKANGSMKLKKSSESACVVMPETVFRIAKEPVHEFRAHSGDVLDVSWSTSKRLLSASTDRTVRLWEIGCADCITVFPHSNFVTCVQVNPADENCFISGSIDGKIRVWDIAKCRVACWADVRQIVTAVCYRPDGKGVVAGTITGNCRFYDASDNLLRLESHVTLNGKKSLLKRITCLQFCPSDPTKLMVTSADSKINILSNADVIQKYSGVQSGSCQLSATFTPDGQYIISASEDSHIDIWNNQNQVQTKQVKTIRSSERFRANNAAIAIPWNGTIRRIPVHFASENQEFFLEPNRRSSATWPEEMLPTCSASTALDESQRKFVRNCCKGESHSWGRVIVTAGLDGRISSFQNYGMPVHE